MDQDSQISYDYLLFYVQCLHMWEEIMENVTNE